MMDASKYKVGYFPVSKEYNKWVEKDHIEKAPIWCSVDMRDGNQSLVIPMSLEEKLEYYKVLLQVGFKEIEVGFPAASETEYEFLRTLIDNNMIPEDVTVQVLTQCREHFSYLCKDISDHEHKELKPDEVLNIFEENYLNLTNGVTVTDFEFMRDKDNVKIGITFAKDGEETEMEAEGNGSLNAINNALRAYTGAEYTLQVFTQHSMQGQGSQSVAASYIGLEKEDGSMFWGAGTDTDVVKANTKALLSAYNNMIKGGD